MALKDKKGQASIELAFVATLVILFLFYIEYMHKITLTFQELELQGRTVIMKKFADVQAGSIFQSATTGKLELNQPVGLKSLYLDSAQLKKFEVKPSISYQTFFEKPTTSGSGSSRDEAINTINGGLNQLKDTLDVEYNRKMLRGSSNPQRPAFRTIP